MPNDVPSPFSLAVLAVRDATERHHLAELAYRIAADNRHVPAAVVADARRKADALSAELTAAWNAAHVLAPKGGN